MVTFFLGLGKTPSHSVISPTRPSPVHSRENRSIEPSHIKESISREILPVTTSSIPSKTMPSPFGLSVATPPTFTFQPPKETKHTPPFLLEKELDKAKDKEKIDQVQKPIFKNPFESTPTPQSVFSGLSFPEKPLPVTVEVPPQKKPESLVEKQVFNIPPMHTSVGFEPIKPPPEVSTINIPSPRREPSTLAESLDEDIPLSSSTMRRREIEFERSIQKTKEIIKLNLVKKYLTIWRDVCHERRMEKIRIAEVDFSSSIFFFFNIKLISFMFMYRRKREGENISRNFMNQFIEVNLMQV